MYSRHRNPPILSPQHYPTTKKSVTPLPRRGSKSLPLIKGDLDSIPIRLQRARHNIIPPPTRRFLTRQLERQKDDNGTNSQPAIETSRSNIIIIGPPTPILVLEILVKDKANDGPGGIIDRRGRRDLAAATEDQRHVDVAEVGFGESAREAVEDERGEGAGEEEPEEVVVDLAGGEDAGGADETPDDGGGEEDAAVGALEVVDVFGRADVVDVGEGPVEDADLDEAGPDGGDHLAGEEHAGRDFHVVAELEVGGEGEGLRHGDVAVRLEEHHGDGAAGLHVADDEFGDDVEAELDVGNGLDHANGDHEDEGDEEGDEEGPPGEVGVVGEDGGEGDAEDAEEGEAVPPCGYFFVLAHHLGVDVGFFAEGELRAGPDLGAVEEEGVGDEGEDGGEGEAVREGEGGGEEERGVCFVGGFVEGEFGGKDLLDVVDALSVVVAGTVGNR